MTSLESTFRGTSVLVTGHTGFTGGWLCSWLDMLDARVSGIGLPPEQPRNLYDPLRLGERVRSYLDNIDDPAAVERVFTETQPRIVFHLAAQPIVARGFADPRGTFMTNVMGTLHVLEAARNCPATQAVVCVTTDKVYRNEEWVYGYRENDPLGGKDPYSASKWGSEAVIATYQRTLAERGNDVAIAAARGGNIIGGGDWAESRIVPDFVRAHEARKPLVLRNPQSTRPWQHVLALAHGYLALADRLLQDRAAIGAWNFGPEAEANRSVGELVEEMAGYWSRPEIVHGTGAFPEANFLHISSEKARAQLGWRPPLDFTETARLTAEWYRDTIADPDSARRITDAQIDGYRAALAAQPAKAGRA